MPEVLTPVIPQDITVHLGAPGSNAQNVTVNFVDYIKNVAENNEGISIPTLSKEF